MYKNTQNSTYLSLSYVWIHTHNIYMWMYIDVDREWVRENGVCECAHFRLTLSLYIG